MTSPTEAPRTTPCPECGGPAKHIQRNSGAWYWKAAAPASPDVMQLRTALAKCYPIIEDWIEGEGPNENDVAEMLAAALPAAAPAPPDVERHAAYVVSGLPVALRLDFIREVARQIGYTVVAATPPTDEEPR